MEKDIKEVLSKVKAPNFSESDSLDEIITKFTDYLKSVERERGLSDEQIKAKYAHAWCLDYVQSIMRLFNYLGKDQKYYMNYRASCKMPNDKKGNHFLLKVFDDKTNQYFFYDIYGKHTFEQVEDIQEHFFIDNKYLRDIVNKMTVYEFDELVAKNTTVFLYGKIEKEKFKKSMEKYDTLYTEEQFKLYNEASKLGLDFKKELKDARDRVALKNEMKKYFLDKKSTSTKQIDERCKDLGLDFNNEMTKARDEVLSNKKSTQSKEFEK